MFYLAFYLEASALEAPVPNIAHSLYYPNNTLLYFIINNLIFLLYSSNLFTLIYILVEFAWVILLYSYLLLIWSYTFFLFYSLLSSVHSFWYHPVFLIPFDSIQRTIFFKVIEMYHQKQDCTLIFNDAGNLIENVFSHSNSINDFIVFFSQF